MIPLYLAKSKPWILTSLSVDKLLLALKSLICLVERHPESPKIVAAKVRFFKHLLSLSEEERKKAIPDERLYSVALSEVAALAGPTNAEGLEKLAEEFKAKVAKDMAGINEYIKLRMKVLPKGGEKYEDLAVAALSAETSPNAKIHVAENLYRRVLKTGAKGEAFKAKAKALFKYAATFQE